MLALAFSTPYVPDITADKPLSSAGPAGFTGLSGASGSAGVLFWMLSMPSSPFARVPKLWVSPHMYFSCRVISVVLDSS